MYKQPPKKLVDLALYASMLKNGAAGLADRDQLIKTVVSTALGRNGWDLSSPDNSVLSSLVLTTLTSFDAREVRYNINKALGEWFHAAPPSVVATLENPAFLAHVEAALDAARYELTTACGQDPLSAPALEKSHLRRSFDAIMGSQLHVKVEKLNKVTESIVSGLGDYAHQAVGREFWYRMFQNLKAQDWPFSHDPDSTLMNELLRLTYNSPNTLGDLQDRMADSRATNFVVNHVEDVAAAAEVVFKTLAQEAKTSMGINVARSVAHLKLSMN